jgi:DNA repair protein RadC
MTGRSHEASTSESFSSSGLEDALLWDNPHEEGSISYAEADLSRPEFTFRIQDIPEDERPRERLFLHGAKALSSAELLSILFGTGHGASGLSSFGLAQSVIQALQNGEVDALERLQRVTVEELQKIPGIGPARAAMVVAAVELGKRVFYRGPAKRTIIDDPALAASALTQDLMWETREHFAIVCLNIRHQLLTTKVLTRGTPTETLAEPRDIFSAALQLGATRIIVAHNHPSGNLDPSPEDISLTRQLLKSANIIGLPVLDHLILGGGNYRSLRQTTNLWQEEPQEVADGGTTTMKDT